MLKVLVISFLFLCSIGTASAQIVVSSKIDTEGGVLGQLVAESLQHAGFDIDNRAQLGGTPVLREAIKAGEIDIYPDYTGNAAFFFNMADQPVWRDQAKGFATAKALDYEHNKIVWLAPAPANNTWAIAIRKDLAKAHNLTTLSDFGRWISAGGEIKLVASAEFVNSPAALPAFQKTYDFTLSTAQMIVLSGGDTAATIRAAAQRTNGANAAMVYGTDGAITAAGLQVLVDDKSVQPIYQPAVLVREATLQAHPKIPDILKPLFQSLDLQTLQRLNGQVQLEGRPAAAVAKAYLQDHNYFTAD